MAAHLTMGCAAAAEEPAIEPPALELTGRVVDAADILSPEFEAQLTEKLSMLEQDTLVQLVVATTPDLEGRDISDYSLELARAWRLGSAERNDGLMLLVAPNERTVRIEVGRGLEASVKDEEAGEIIRRDMIPQFRNSEFEAGIDAGVDSLVSEVTPHHQEEAA